jgi:hypothetical protein
MTMSTSALSNRAMSAFPCSIGTSLTLESLFNGTLPPYDPERVIPQRVDINNYKSFYINLMTLYRNLMGSLQKNDSGVVLPGDLAEVLEFEVELIKNLVNEATHGKTKAIFYASNYKALDKKYPHAFIKQDNTEKQKYYTSVMETTIGQFFKKSVKSDEIVLFDLHLKVPQKVKGLILTHYAFDLLSQKQFTHLDLIESHTGVLKGPSLFYTKFTQGKELMRIPFQEWSLQVFGDSQTFNSFPIKVRKIITDLADEYAWTWNTTPDRIRFCLDRINDIHTAAVIKSMFS